MSNISKTTWQRKHKYLHLSPDSPFTSLSSLLCVIFFPHVPAHHKRALLVIEYHPHQTWQSTLEREKKMKQEQSSTARYDWVQFTLNSPLELSVCWSRVSFCPSVPLESFLIFYFTHSMQLHYQTGTQTESQIWTFYSTDLPFILQSYQGPLHSLLFPPA